MFSSPLGLIAAEDSSSGGGAAIFQLFFFGLIFVAMYFLLIRPQRRRTRDAQALNRALAEGDEVQTASGIVGRSPSLSRCGIDEYSTKGCCCVASSLNTMAYEYWSQRCESLEASCASGAIYCQHERPSV